MPHWLPAFLVAAVVALIAAPRMRRLSRSQDAPDGVPGQTTQGRTVPCAAGAAVILAVLVAMLFEPGLGRDGAVLIAIAAVVAAVGLAGDGAGRATRHLLVEAGAAVLAVVLGVRIQLTGSELLDAVLTVVWIVFVMNAFSRLDDTDGAATAGAVVALTGVFLLAVLAARPVVTTLAAATMGACMAFLVYNRPPASVRLGRSGSGFLGFVLAVLALSTGSVVGPTLALTVPILLLAVPLLDAGTVMSGRLRRGLPLSVPRDDHLYHRLLARGWSRARALTALVGADLSGVALAVLAGRGAIPVGMAVVGGGAVLGALAAAAVTIPVDPQPVQGRRRGLVLTAVALVVASIVLSVPALLAVIGAVEPARAAESTVRRGTHALEAGDGDAAAKDFELAAMQFADARGRLDGLLSNAAKVVPGMASNFVAAKTLVSVGEDLANAGSAMGQLAGPGGMPVRNGSVALDEVRALTPVLAAASRSIDRSLRRLQGLERAWLAPQLSRAVDELETLLRDRQLAARTGAEMARLLPGILGETEPKRYFLAFQNNSELRGTGGFIGNWGILLAEGGGLRLERFGRLVELQAALMQRGPAPVPPALVERWPDFGLSSQWQQVNASPDFPTAAQVIDLMYAHSGGEPIDGVIAIDPAGLSGLLQVTGPVSVESWPEPITSANVVDVTLVRAYERYPLEQDALRIAFLGDVARAVTEAFTTRQLGTGRQLLSALAPAVQGRHLMIYSKDASTQELVGDVGADGAVPSLQGDALLLVNQNVVGHKIDTYLRRKVRYEIELSPRKGNVAVSGRADVSLTNDVPSLDLPGAVIGPYLPKFRAGENRTHLSMYSPFLTGPVLLEGEAAHAQSHFDVDRPSRSLTLSLEAGQTRTLSFGFEGHAELGAERWYRLDLLRQPLLTPDDMTVVVGVPEGWRIAAVRGATAEGPSRRKTIRLQLTQPQTLWLRMEPTGTNRLWDALLR